VTNYKSNSHKNLNFGGMGEKKKTSWQKDTNNVEAQKALFVHIGSRATLTYPNYSILSSEKIILSAML